MPDMDKLALNSSRVTLPSISGHHVVQVAILERDGAALALTDELELDLRTYPRRAPLQDVPGPELDLLPHLVQE